MRRYCQGIAGIVLLAAVAACSDTGTQDGKVPFKGTNPEQFNALANQMKKVQAKNAQAAAFDLLDNIKQGKVKLEELKKEELPEELRKLDAKGQKEYLEKLEKKRAELSKKAIELDKKRSDFIAEKQKEEASKGKAGFDQQVLEILRKQANKRIDY